MTDLPHTDPKARLQREWRRLRTRPAALATARCWELTDGPVHSLDDVLAAVGFGVPSTAATERRLRELVLIAAHDELAARVVIQRLLPGLLAAAGRRHGMTASPLDELLGAAWIAIRSYNPARSPRCLAASLISDADYGAFRAAGRRRSSGERPVDLDFTRIPHQHEPAACDLLAEVLADAAEHGISETDLEFVRRLLAASNSEELAASMNVTSRTIRNRRRKVTTALREVAVAA